VSLPLQMLIAVRSCRPTGSSSPGWSLGFKQRAAGTMRAETPEPPETLTVVVGYDGSDAARRGLARVRQLTARRLTVVVVAAQPDVRSPGLGAELSGVTVDAERLLREAREFLDADGVAIETRSAVGDPAAVLIDIARESSAGLVIVGRRGGDFVTRTLLGSVAQRVVHNAPCDVLVVA
jgi:nucleotide-binding universal stress UspA family protein